jgi:hypothetical protein
MTPAFIASYKAWRVSTDPSYGHDKARNMMRLLDEPARLAKHHAGAAKVVELLTEFQASHWSADVKPEELTNILVVCETMLSEALAYHEQQTRIENLFASGGF